MDSISFDYFYGPFVPKSFLKFLSNFKGVSTRFCESIFQMSPSQTDIIRMPKQKKSNEPCFIRSSSHSLRDAKASKLPRLKAFLNEYQKAVDFYLNFLWLNRISWSSKDDDHFFDIANDNLDIPSVLSTVGIHFKTLLSGRALKCAMTQALGIVRSATEKRRKRLFVLAEMKANGDDTAKLQSILDNSQLCFPPKVPKDIKAELDSNCIDWKSTSRHFDGFIRLKCLDAKDHKTFGQIKLPISFHRQALKWSAKGTMMTSFLVGEKSIDIRWSIPQVAKKTSGVTVGADQGISTCLSLSNGKVTQPCPHGHTLSSIQSKMTKKAKGSKAFIRCQEHRENYINWSINQLDLAQLCQINMEKVAKVRFGKRSSRFQSHWCYTLIETKVSRIAEENGVQLKLQTSSYRSQRCSNCGYVHESNRKGKGKVFLCQACGYADDADINAAKNHEQDLNPIPKWLFNEHLARNGKPGFYWLSKGLLIGAKRSELTVPNQTKKKKVEVVPVGPLTEESLGQ